MENGSEKIFPLKATDIEYAPNVLGTFALEIRKALSPDEEMSG